MRPHCHETHCNNFFFHLYNLKTFVLYKFGIDICQEFQVARRTNMLCNVLTLKGECRTKFLVMRLRNDTWHNVQFSCNKFPDWHVEECINYVVKGAQNDTWHYTYFVGPCDCMGMWHAVQKFCDRCPNRHVAALRNVLWSVSILTSVAFFKYFVTFVKMVTWNNVQNYFDSCRSVRYALYYMIDNGCTGAGLYELSRGAMHSNLQYILGWCGMEYYTFRSMFTCQLNSKLVLFWNGGADDVRPSPVESLAN